MTYFGMWKSFFSWHLEDRDLYSINYLHFGAPKVWYCVSPADKQRFDRMAQSVFPELHKSCRAFMRHKDVLLSPAQLRAFSVPYLRVSARAEGCCGWCGALAAAGPGAAAAAAAGPWPTARPPPTSTPPPRLPLQAKQEPGEFVVLNAAAYHAGFNCGFNCAEAVNFAMPEWLTAGRASGNCHCGLLKDCVGGRAARPLPARALPGPLLLLAAGSGPCLRRAAGPLPWHRFHRTCWRARRPHLSLSPRGAGAHRHAHLRPLL